MSSGTIYNESKLFECQVVQFTMKVNFLMLILISHFFSSVGSNSICIEIFVNTGYFINVFFVYKLNRRRRVLKHGLCKCGFCSVQLVKNRLKIDYWFILCIGLLPLILKKNNNSSTGKLFYTVGLLRNSAIDENNFL